ncbi:unnamed protein product [Euphydryas editha]|uniref:Uncharacterized protein n=1 Tax=Euphydryas editha TaxID=104508 RepID=A0AAU9TM05_EUPED|nr:unnamed protein product [Euphydryas editha]
MESQADNITSEQILNALRLEYNKKAIGEFQLAGTVPASKVGTEIKNTLTIFGITPEDFTRAYSSVEFDFNQLKETFKSFCKDFNDPLYETIPSKALEFAAKMLFEYGPYIRTERRSKGDKAIRFRFPYSKKIKDKTGELSFKVVIVTTFKEMDIAKQVDDGKLILTFRQAGLLAMVTFSKAIEY